MDHLDTPDQAAQRQLDAYNARDIEAFLSVYSPTCTVRAFPSGALMLEGADAMRTRYATLFEEHPALHCTLLARVVHGAIAIDHEHVEGLREGEVVYAVAMYEVREGLIQNVWFLKDDASG